MEFGDLFKILGFIWNFGTYLGFLDLFEILGFIWDSRIYLRFWDVGIYFVFYIFLGVLVFYGIM